MSTDLKANTKTKITSFEDTQRALQELQKKFNMLVERIASPAEKALEDVEDMYQDSLHGRKRYDPNLLRDYASHVRWKVQKVLPDRFGEAKQRTGVEISDGTLRVVWETDGSSKDSI